MDDLKQEIEKVELEIEKVELEIEKTPSDDEELLSVLLQTKNLLRHENNLLLRENNLLLERKIRQENLSIFPSVGLFAWLHKHVLTPLSCKSIPSSVKTKKIGRADSELDYLSEKTSETASLLTLRKRGPVKMKHS